MITRVGRTGRFEGVQGAKRAVGTSNFSISFTAQKFYNLLFLYIFRNVITMIFILTFLSRVRVTSLEQLSIVDFSGE